MKPITLAKKAPFLLGERAGARTRDPMIKSHVLYQLSYALPGAHLGHRAALSKPKPQPSTADRRSRRLTLRRSFALLDHPGRKAANSRAVWRRRRVPCRSSTVSPTSTTRSK